MAKIYLASPYSHISEDVRQQRFEAACVAAGKLILDGHIVFSPIAHSHNIHAVGGLPGSWDFWKNIDISFIKWADQVNVLMLQGWEDSQGVWAEIDIAKTMDKPVYYIEP